MLKTKNLKMTSLLSTAIILLSFNTTIQIGIHYMSILQNKHYTELQ